MSKLNERKRANEIIGAKYSINRLTPISGDSVSTGDVFTSPIHVSQSLEDSLQWFGRQKQIIRSKGALFEDSFFPATDSSLVYSKPLTKRIIWKRPKEICPNPLFIADGVSRFDVVQGELGDCWLLAAVSSLSMYPQLFYQVIPENQDFSRDYVGAFMFRLWQFGTWVDVVVDDRLPTSRDRLVYMHSKDLNEFWSALLEKAYAKLSKSYEALKGGSSSEAMEDFTGGITELIDLGPKAPPNLWDIMVKGSSRASLMGCSIEAEPGQVEAKAEQGLIKGHAYSITDIKTVTSSRGEVKLIRVRNPWGNECEWTGAWSDQSQEWQNVSESERQHLAFSRKDDGEFWMSLNDFIRYFSKLEICHLSPESEIENKYGKKKTKWEMCIENGEWQKHVSAGGCRNFLETFHMNPQFRFTVVDPDEDDDEDCGTVIISLMQKEMRGRWKNAGNMSTPGVANQTGIPASGDLLTIGYAVYKLKDNSYDNAVLDTKFFKFNASCAKSAFINIRDVCGRHKLPVGKYVIVPSTFNPNEEAKFLMRIFSETVCHSEQMDQKTEISVPNWQKDVPPETSIEEERRIERLRMAFKNIAGEDGEIDSDELQQILDACFKRDFKFNGFSRETSRSLLAMMDADQSGKLEFNEFRVLWDDLRLWKTVFKKFDQDQSGNFNSYELREAMNYLGFQVSNRVFAAVITRYTSKGIVTFDDYILLLVRLRTVFLTFKAQRKTTQGDAVFPQDEFMQCVLYS